MYIYIHVQAYTHMHVTRLCYTQLYLHTCTPAHARAHTSTQTRECASAVAAAHNGPRRIEHPTSASRLPWRAAQAGKAAHTLSMFDTRAVFHAPMFALNADAERNACRAEPPAVHADGTALASAGADACAPNPTRTHARAHGCSTGARVCGGPASAIRSSV